MRSKRFFVLASAIWAMSRPLIMLSVILVYVDGLLIARAFAYPLSLDKIICGLITLLLISASIHYINEYADYETDALTIPTRYSGGSGILPRGNVPRSLALQMAWITLILGFIVAFLGFWLGLMNLTTMICLVLGALGGWMYSVSPLKLAWRGWGELLNALLGGLLLHIYAFSLLSGQLTLQIIIICIPFTLLTFNNLLATTWADKSADAQVGKNTLATKLTNSQLRRLYAIVAICAFVLLILLYDWMIPNFVVVASFLALPMVFWGWRTYTRIQAPYPTSNAMVVLLLAQMIAWYALI